MDNETTINPNQGAIQMEKGTLSIIEYEGASHPCVQLSERMRIILRHPEPPVIEVDNLTIRLTQKETEGLTHSLAVNTMASKLADMFGDKEEG